jgi:hypothetical protein
VTIPLSQLSKASSFVISETVFKKSDQKKTKDMSECDYSTAGSEPSTQNNSPHKDTLNNKGPALGRLEDWNNALEEPSFDVQPVLTHSASGSR